MKTVILMRHGDAVTFASRDYDRALSDDGRREVASMRNFLASRGLAPQHAIVSPAMRTRQTFEHLALRLDPQFDDGLYSAGGLSVIETISTTPDDIETLILVGHAPGVPSAVRLLTDIPASDHDVWEKVREYFPTATGAVLTFDTPTWDLAEGTGRLVAAHRPLYS